MAYDEVLADRIDANLSRPSDVTERKMFGGLAFMLDGNMCHCVTELGLVVRVGTNAYENALAQPHAGLMDLTGRPMKGWVLIDFAGLESETRLSQWIKRSADFAAALPAK